MVPGPAPGTGFRGPGRRLGLQGQFLPSNPLAAVYQATRGTASTYAPGSAEGPGKFCYSHSWTACDWPLEAVGIEGRPGGVFCMAPLWSPPHGFCRWLSSPRVFSWPSLCAICIPTSSLYWMRAHPHDLISS